MSLSDPSIQRTRRSAPPGGLHPATLLEFEERFGHASELRRVQIQSVRWMTDLAWRAGVQRILVNGSFVTDVMEPNDVDCALLIGPGFPRDAAAERELMRGLPFLEILFVDQADFDYFVGFFGSDRTHNPKGMIEVLP